MELKNQLKNKKLWWAAIIVTAAAALGIGSKYFIPGMRYDDNMVEEACEKVIESKTGVDVDLTPSSKEK